MNAAHTTPNAPAALAAAAAVMLAALLHLPFLGTAELDDEEGRRAWPAREMLASGDYVVPTIYGEPYLAKPPLFFWAVAGAARALDRPVDELTTRLPSALATLLTAAAVALVAGHLGGRRAAWIAGLGFTATLGVLEKGAFGELEAALGLACFVSTGAVVLGRGRGGARGLGWALLAGSALGAALLIKGPPALLFFGAALLGARRAGDAPAALRRPHPWLALLLGLGLAGLWVLALRADPRGAEALATWREETVGRGERDLLGLLRERASFLVGFAGQAFPLGWIALAALGTTTRRTLRRTSPGWNAATWIIGAGLVALLVAPGPRPRYAYPLLPWCAVAGALALESLLARRTTGDPDARLERRLWAVVAPTLLLGLTLAGAGAWAMIAPIEDIGPLSWPGLALALLAAAAGVAAARAQRRRRIGLTLACGLAVLGALRLVERGEVVRQTGDRLRRAADGAEIEALVPANETLHVLPWDLFNTLFYVDRPIRRATSAAALPPGSWFVAIAPWSVPAGVEVAGELTIHAGDRVVVGRRLDGSTGD